MSFLSNDPSPADRYGSFAPAVRWLHSYRRQAPVSAAIATGCIGLWLVVLLQGGFSRSGLAAATTLFGPLVDSPEAWWDWLRPLSSSFMHLDATHLLLNMLMLIFIGREVESYCGSRDFCVIYLNAALGSAALVLSLNYAVPTVGASGAVYGLMALLVMVQRAQGMNLLPAVVLIVVNIGYSLIIPGVSLWGHIGGLLAGVVLAVVYSRAPQPARFPLSLAVAAALSIWIWF